MLHNTVGASPRGSVTIPASTELNAATQVISGYDSQNATEAKPRNAPFIPEPFITGKSISWIKLNVLTAGTMTIGCYKISDIVLYDEEVAGSYISLRALNVSTTGEQTLTLSPSVYIPSGYALAICTTADTCTFAYGNYGTTMSYYWFENSTPRVVRQTATKSLGLDIGCVEVTFTEDTVNGRISVSVNDSEAITPSVTAGYVDSVANGSAFISTSSTYQLSTQAAQAIHPSASDQTIAGGKYLTGAQTVKAVTLTNLTAENIKKDVVVKVGDSTDDDCVASVAGTYEASGGGEEDVWELINSTTTTAEVASLMWNTDTNGDGFSLRKIMIVGTFVCPDAATNTGVGVAGAATAGGTAGWNNGGLWTGGNWVPQGAGVAAGTASHMVIMLENRLYDLEIGGWTLSVLRSANATSMNGQVYSNDAGAAARWAHQMTSNSTSDLFTLSSGVPATLSKVWFGSYSAVFGVGSTFRLYGVRA